MPKLKFLIAAAAAFVAVTAQGQVRPFGYLVDSLGTPLKTGVYSDAQMRALPVGVAAFNAAGALLDASGNVVPTGAGSVTSVSVTTANGVSGTVATATTTPAISLTLGAITPTSVNGNTVTAGTGTLTLGSATLNAGAGGTLGSAAFTAANAYEVPLTFSTGLTRAVNSITVNTSQNISTLSNLTSNGIVTTSGGTGALSITATTGSGSVALATSPVFVTPTLGVATATSLADAKGDVRELPQNVQDAAYPIVLTDAGKSIIHTGATPRTYTLPANDTIPIPVSSMITFVNLTGAAVLTIAITTDTMYLAGPGTTGSRTMTGVCIATAYKATTTTWIISGGSCLT